MNQIGLKTGLAMLSTWILLAGVWISLFILGEHKLFQFAVNLIICTCGIATAIKTIDDAVKRIQQQKEEK